MRRWKGIASGAEIDALVKRLLQSLAEELMEKSIPLWQVDPAITRACAPARSFAPPSPLSSVRSERGTGLPIHALGCSSQAQQRRGATRTLHSAYALG